MNLEEIKLLITEAKENTVVILQCPESELEIVASNVNLFKERLEIKKVLILVCPLEFKITVVPPGNNISGEEQP